MRRYALHLDRSARSLAGSGWPIPLRAEALDEAKYEAAVLYARTDGPSAPPGYRIVGGSGKVVYRYPEATA